MVLLLMVVLTLILTTLILPTMQITGQIYMLPFSETLNISNSAIFAITSGITCWDLP
jgi:hypothetical protein